MAQTQTVAPPVAGESWGSMLGNLYFAPREAFRALLVRSGFWVPLLALIALNVTFTAIWLQNVDPHEFMRTQIEESGRADRMSPEQLQAVVDGQAGMFSTFAWLGQLVFLPLFFLAVAAVYLFIFRFLLGGEVRYRASLAVVGWSFLAVSIITTPLILLVMMLKGDWNVDPRTAVLAGPALLLEKGSTSPWLYALVDSVDLFSFWVLALLAAGYGVANRRTTGWAVGGVVGLWVAYVAGKVALAAVF
jgi:Yip1 domain